MIFFLLTGFSAMYIFIYGRRSVGQEFLSLYTAITELNRCAGVLLLLWGMARGAGALLWGVFQDAPLFSATIVSLPR